MSNMQKKTKNAVVIVAHPDDEILWAGGMILMHPDWKWTIAVLCRASDPDRSVKFNSVIKELGANGKMADLDDSPEQSPIDGLDVQKAIISLLPKKHFDVVITHSPFGEYTRHIRHEEVNRAVIVLWENGNIKSNEIRLFAYEDGGNSYLPRPINNAHNMIKLPDTIWQKKYSIITQLYGFGPESFEAKIAPKEEAFWCFRSVDEFYKWLNKRGKKL
jgi:LmbE family N-acetylglucosaminyl deacetylase